MATDLREQIQTSLGAAYKLERELGGGGMSRVFVAEETRLKRRVVVKVLRPDLAAGLSAERFAREVRFAATLQHPCIVPLLAAGEAEGLPYYTMPLVDGESLRDRIRRAPLDRGEILAVLRDVAAALTYAHVRGIVHRDLKPENVLLSGGYSMVTDFGIAKAVADSTIASEDALTGQGATLGTPGYMAPEQIAGDPAMDHRADIYSFGVLAYELVGGVHPFAGRSLQATLVAHLVETPQPLGQGRDDVPPKIAALVARCLAKEPSERPQRLDDALAVLESICTPACAPNCGPAPAAGPPGD